MCELSPQNHHVEATVDDAIVDRVLCRCGRITDVDRPSDGGPKCTYHAVHPHENVRVWRCNCGRVLAVEYYNMASGDLQLGFLVMPYED